MKPLNWNIVNVAKVKGTIFEKIDDEKVNLQTKELEDLFSKPQ